MDNLGLSPGKDCLKELQAAYSQPQRHYHNAAHVNACLAELDRTRNELESPDIVEIAIWFHDAIYDARASDNEEKSADWAECFLTENGGDPAAGDTVRRLIMATQHEFPSDDVDAQVLADIDLSILGAPESCCDVYESAIRLEYRHVPDRLFRTGRAKVLSDFLNRSAIFQRRSFAQRYEEQARSNLRRALNALACRGAKCLTEDS